MCSESGKTIWPQYSTNSTNTFKSSKTKGESDDGTAFPIIKMISLTRITNHQCGARSNLKNTINVVSSQCRTFQISLGANLFSDSFALHRKYHADTGREGIWGPSHYQWNGGISVSCPRLLLGLLVNRISDRRWWLGFPDNIELLHRTTVPQ